MGDATYDPELARTRFEQASGLTVSDPLLVFAADVARNASEAERVVATVRSGPKRGLRDVLRRLRAQPRVRRLTQLVFDRVRAINAEAIDDGGFREVISDFLKPLEETGFVRTAGGRGRPSDIKLRDFVYVYTWLSDVVGRPLRDPRLLIDAACALGLIAPRLRERGPELAPFLRQVEEARAIPAFDITNRSAVGEPSPARFLAAEVTRMTTIDGVPFRELPTDTELVLWISWQYVPYTLWPWRQVAYYPEGPQLALHLRLDDLAVDGDPARYDIRVALQLPASLDEALSVAPEAIRMAQPLCLKLIAQGMDDLEAPGISVTITPHSGPPKVR